MGFEFIKKLPTSAEIKQQYPVPEKVAQIKKERDEEIRKVFTGESDKFLAIIGPCSADNEDSVCDYITATEAGCDCILIASGHQQKSDLLKCEPKSGSVTVFDSISDAAKILL